MSLFPRFFRRPPKAADADEPLVPVPIPPLVVLLDALERKKGAPLTEEEVLEARDTAPCITMKLSDARSMAESRGFYDINPENAWAEWLEFPQQQGPLH